MNTLLSSRLSSIADFVEASHEAVESMVVRPRRMRRSDGETITRHWVYVGTGCDYDAVRETINACPGVEVCGRETRNKRFDVRVFTRD